MDEITDETLVPYDLASRGVKLILSGLCRDFKCDINTRPAKDVERIREKIKDGKELGTIYDLGGVRVVLHYLEEIEQIQKRIFESPKLWKLHHSGSFVNKVNDPTIEFFPGHFQNYLDDPRMGYRSLHIVVYYPVSDSENQFFPPAVKLSDDHKSKFPVEIQLRTYLLHAWEEKEHVLYSKRVKSEFIRGQFYSIAKMLWHLDVEFDGFRSQILQLRSKEREGK